MAGRREAGGWGALGSGAFKWVEKGHQFLNKPVKALFRFVCILFTAHQCYTTHLHNHNQQPSRKFVALVAVVSVALLYLPATSLTMSEEAKPEETTTPTEEPKAEEEPKEDEAAAPEEEDKVKEEESTATFEPVVSFVFIANLCVICARVKRGELGLCIGCSLLMVMLALLKMKIIIMQ